MVKQEVARIGWQLDELGHALTSFDQLGLDQFGPLASDLLDTVSRNPQLQPERMPGRVGMVMCKDEASKQAGKRLIRPVVEVLFEGNQRAIEEWDPYTVNQYNEGDFFSPHQDYLDGTVIIATVQGVRELDVYRKELDDDLFLTVEHSYRLTRGSVLLLNGFMDLGHAARCIEGPSISVVGDVSERVSHN